MTANTTTKHTPRSENVKRELDPYAPIEKRTLSTPDGMRSAGYSVRIADHSHPSGWRECGVVSQDYLVVPNADVRDIAFEIAERSPFRFSEAKTFFDGKRFALSLVATDDGLVETRVGDLIGVGLRAVNDYSGTHRLSVGLFAYRLACKNGMLVRDGSVFPSSVAFRHVQSSRGWEGDVRRALSMVASAPAGLARFAEAARSLASMRVSASRLREVRQGPLARLPVTTWGRVIDRLLEDEELDMHGLLDAGTNVLWHDEKPTWSGASWNAYLTSGLLEYGLGAARSN